MAVGVLIAMLGLFALVNDGSVAFGVVLLGVGLFTLAVALTSR